jgi:hypothetical protein
MASASGASSLGAIFGSSLRSGGGGRGRLVAGKKAHDAFGRFAAGAGVVAVEPVQAGAGVGVDDRQGCLFFKQVVERGNQHRVLEHVGVVAGMEGVAVTEHGNGPEKMGWTTLDSRAETSIYKKRGRRRCEELDGDFGACASARVFCLF